MLCYVVVTYCKEEKCDYIVQNYDDAPHGCIDNYGREAKLDAETDTRALRILAHIVALIDLHPKGQRVPYIERRWKDAARAASKASTPGEGLRTGMVAAGVAIAVSFAAPVATPLAIAAAVCVTVSRCFANRP